LFARETNTLPARSKMAKFYFLFLHVAIITGIAWDHIHVFPTFAIYLEQFQDFY
jgi:UDP-N-acetylmuramate: L-alanyl-gamma-D-glutamyl-meso-diaminopimelate ligase